jgi:hypothetical protein
MNNVKQLCQHDGFEEEDLFPQLSSFFKPLTVAARDSLVNREEQEEKELEFELRSFTAEYQTIGEIFLHIANEIDQLKKEQTTIQNDLSRQKTIKNSTKQKREILI